MFYRSCRELYEAVGLSSAETRGYVAKQGRPGPEVAAILLGCCIFVTLILTLTLGVKHLRNKTAFVSVYRFRLTEIRRHFAATRHVPWAPNIGISITRLRPGLQMSFCPFPLRGANITSPIFYLDLRCHFAAEEKKKKGRNEKCERNWRKHPST